MKKNKKMILNTPKCQRQLLTFSQSKAWVASSQYSLFRRTVEWDGFSQIS